MSDCSDDSGISGLVHDSNTKAKLTLESDSATPKVEALQEPTTMASPELLIRIPDMFSSIMAVKPVVNPHYHDVKPRADAWIAKIMGADAKWSQRNSRVDLCYLASIWAPECDAAALRIMVDWNHWVFLFDDQFDEGHLSHDLNAAKAEVDVMIAIMEGTGPVYDASRDPIRYVYQNTWDRVQKRASRQAQQHWKEMHKQYFEGLLDQVATQVENRTFCRDIDQYMSMRRGTIGAYPAIALAEVALGIDLPAEVLAHESLKECMCISADLVLLVNDVLSYKKDLQLGVDHNLINLLKGQEHSIQQAVDVISSMLEKCYRRWYIALANLPPFGEKLDRQVLTFVETCRNVALGNLYWR
jgi:hypothetical protein